MNKEQQIQSNEFMQKLAEGKEDFDSEEKKDLNLPSIEVVERKLKTIAQKKYLFALRKVNEQFEQKKINKDKAKELRRKIKDLSKKELGYEIIDYERFECLKTLEGHKNYVNSVIETHDGKIVSASNDKTIKIWDITTSRCLKTLEGHDNYAKSITETHDGKIVSALSDKTIKIWDKTTGNCLKTLRGHDDEVNSIIETHDGKIVSASDDKTIKIWGVPDE